MPRLYGRFMNIIFFILLFLAFNAQSARAAIEVYSAGKHFDSFEAYKGVVPAQTQQEEPALVVHVSGVVVHPNVSLHSGELLSQDVSVLAVPLKMLVSPVRLFMQLQSVPTGRH